MLNGFVFVYSFHYLAPPMVGEVLFSADSVCMSVCDFAMMFIYLS